MSNILTEYAVLYRFRFSGNMTSAWTDCRETRADAEEDAAEHYGDGCKIVGIYAIDNIGGTVTLLENADEFTKRMEAKKESEEPEEIDARARRAEETAFRREYERDCR